MELIKNKEMGPVIYIDAIKRSYASSNVAFPYLTNKFQTFIYGLVKYYILI